MNGFVRETYRRMITAFTLSIPISLRPVRLNSTLMTSCKMTLASHQAARPKVLIITGPTSVGKSSTALELCKRINGEVISADSVQLYRYLDVGSNKATPHERILVRHHLIDIADPCNEFTAGDFFRAARRATEDVLSRTSVPVVVGGTMMYVRWFIHGRPATPPADDEARHRVERAIKACDGNWEAGIALLAEQDAQRAGKLTKNDWYRLGRALEIVETTGKGVTDIPVVGGAPRPIDEKDLLDYDFRCVFLIDNRLAMNRRIDRRCESMVLPSKDKHGRVNESIVEEVCSLLIHRKLSVEPGSPCLAIGYRQTIAYLLQRAIVYADIGDRGSDDGDISDVSDTAANAFRQFLEGFQQATRNYAKQQIAWFRKEPLFQWVHAGPDAIDKIEALLDLNMDDYVALQERNRDAQNDMREEMIRQGKGMKTYISEQTRLKRGSDEETEAIQKSEQCAQMLAKSIDIAEMQSMLKVVK